MLVLNLTDLVSCLVLGRLLDRALGLSFLLIGLKDTLPEVSYWL